QNILEGEQGMAAGMSKDANPAALSDRLGSRWALAETSFKFHASCRHTHPAADALLDLMQREQLGADDIASVITRVHQGAIDVLGRVVVPQTVHQAKFSMGTVLGLIALYGKAGLTEFHTHALTDPRVGQFREKVSMMLDAQVDDAYPARWLGRVEVNTRDGRTLHGAIDEPKGDPGNTLSRAELEDKVRRLVQFSGARSADEAQALIEQVWRLREIDDLNALDGRNVGWKTAAGLFRRRCGARFRSAGSSRNGADVTAAGLERTRGKGFAVFHPTPNLQDIEMNDTTTKPRPLDGITVVSLEHAIAAPFCTRQLADLGARVIKVERPGAGDFARGYDERVDGLASHFVWTNRSKESLTLDVKQEAASQVLDQLLAKADVLVQ